MEELETTTSDLSSLLSSTDIAVIFLDAQFRIRRFTPAVRDLVDFIPSDIGRPLKLVVLVRPAPRGTVHSSPSGASQFAVMIGAVANAQPLPKL